MDRQVAAAGFKALVKVESETGGSSGERGGSSVGTEDKVAKLCTVITIEWPYFVGYWVDLSLSV